MATKQVYQSKKSIEDFKSNLANGGVRPTMFEVQITFPTLVTGAGSTGDDGNSTPGNPRPSAAELTEKSTFLVKASSLPGSNIGMISVPFRGRKLKVAVQPVPLNQAAHVALARLEFVNRKDHRLHRQKSPVAHPCPGSCEKLAKLASELLDKHYGVGERPTALLALLRRFATDILGRFQKLSSSRRRGHGMRK